MSLCMPELTRACGLGVSETEAECSEGSSVLEGVDSPRRPMLALPAPPSCPSHHEQAAQTLPVSLPALSPEASSTQVECLHAQAGFLD